MKHSFSALVAILMIPFVMSMTACSTSTIAQLANTLGTTAANVAKIEGNTTLASKLTTDTAAAVVAIQNWKSGTPAQEVIESLNLVADDLSLFPVTDQYAPLIDLAIATVDSILTLLPQAPAATPALSAHTAQRHVTLPFATPKNSKDFKNQWNSIVAQNPALAKAKI